MPVQSPGEGWAISLLPPGPRHPGGIEYQIEEPRDAHRISHQTTHREETKNTVVATHTHTQKHTHIGRKSRLPNQHSSQSGQRGRKCRQAGVLFILSFRSPRSPPSRPTCAVCGVFLQWLVHRICSLALLCLCLLDRPKKPSICLASVDSKTLFPHTLCFCHQR